MTTVPFREAVRVWWYVAAHSFGGPAGQIAVIHRAVVDERQWIDESQFLRALSYCMLLPGPEAQQLATYIGWRLHGTRGGLTAGLLFVLPGFVTILALSIVYVLYHDVAMVSAVFFGLKPAVLVIVIEALGRLRTRAMGGRGSMLIAAAAFVAIFWLEIPFPFIMVAAALVGLILHPRGQGLSRPATQRPSTWRLLRTVGLWLAIWLVPVGGLILAAGPDSVFTHLAVFFSQAAVVTFGGAYSVLAYVAQQAVDVHGWLAPGEMLDGLGLAETTPGPLIMVVQFVGFLGAYRQAVGMDPLVAGILGSLVTTWVTFAPCFLFIFAGAPYIEYLTGQPRLQAALSGVMAAVVGVVLNLAVWFGLHTMFRDVGNWRSLDAAALTIFLLALLAALRFRLGMFAILGLGAGAGIVAHLIG